MCTCFRPLPAKLEDANAKLLESHAQIAWEPNSKSRPRIDWVVGLDFGTTYSGFAYAKAVVDEPDIHVFYDWPRKENERSYCKTLTGLFYKREAPSSPSWGYCARTEYANHRHCTTAPHGLYLTRFKLLLKEVLTDPHIPAPLTLDTIITDYLKCIGEKALSVIENHEGKVNFCKDSVQWCITVPSIWDETAKQKMKECMVNAGLVAEQAAVKVALEPEAASFNCHQILLQKRRDVSPDVTLYVQDKILVADVGGGTVDIVVQELLESGDHTYKVKELTKSSGGLYGGTFVDQSFMRFLSQKIGCLEEFLREDCPSYRTRLLKDWEEIKCAFGNEMVDTDYMSLQLHYKLASKWEDFEKERGNLVHDYSYDAVELTKQDLQFIFDPVVEEILKLIAAQ